MDGEEATVRAMREAGNTWRVIAQHLGQDQYEMYQRYESCNWNQPLRAAYNADYKRRKEAKAARLAARAERAARRATPRVRTRGNGPIATLLRSDDDLAVFWAKVNKDGPIQSDPDLGPCWMWIGTIDSQGYGSYRYRGKTLRAHRLAYRIIRGPTHYATLDHLCHTLAKYCSGGRRCWHRRCVNPTHLEDIPLQENGYRAGHRTGRNACRNGHIWDSGNTLFDVRGYRVCRTCVADGSD